MLSSVKRLLGLPPIKVEDFKTDVKKNVNKIRNEENIPTLCWSNFLDDLFWPGDKIAYLERQKIVQKCSWVKIEETIYFLTPTLFYFDHLPTMTLLQKSNCRKVQVYIVNTKTSTFKDLKGQADIPYIWPTNILICSPKKILEILHSIIFRSWDIWFSNFWFLLENNKTST